MLSAPLIFVFVVISIIVIITIIQKVTEFLKFSKRGSDVSGTASFNFADTFIQDGGPSNFL